MEQFSLNEAILNRAFTSCSARLACHIKHFFRSLPICDFNYPSIEVVSENNFSVSTMLKWLSLWLILISLNVETISAAPILTIDQQNTELDPTMVIGVGTLTFGQSFTPTLSRIDAVEVALKSGPSTWKIEILEGSGLNGDILAFSSPVTFTRPIPVSDPVHFDLVTHISVTPGNQYTVRLSNVSGGAAAVGIPNSSGIDSYLGGSAFFPFSTGVTDILFSVGLHTAVPEPSTLLLGVMLSFGLLTVRIRK